MLNIKSEDTNSCGSLGFQDQTNGTADELNNVLCDNSDLINKIKNDPNFLPTYEQITQLIFSNSYYDLKILGDIFPNQNEIITKELINKIANIVETSITVLSQQYEQIIILEVGAGRGRLSLALNNELISRGSKKFKMITTDKNIDDSKLLDIEQLPYDKAIDKYKPHIILNARMPQIWISTFKNISPKDVEERVWTHKFCENENTQLFILLGVPGLSGDPRFIWGHEHYNLKEITSYRHGKTLAPLIPYINKGFQRFPNITPGINIHNNGFKTISDEEKNPLAMINDGYSRIYQRDWDNNSDGYFYERSITSAFIKNKEIIRELRKKQLL